MEKLIVLVVLCHLSLYCQASIPVTCPPTVTIIPTATNTSTSPSCFNEGYTTWGDFLENLVYHCTFKALFYDCINGQFDTCWDTYKNKDFAVAYWQMYTSYKKSQCKNANRANITNEQCLDDICSMFKCVVKSAENLNEMYSSINDHCSHTTFTDNENEKKTTCKNQCMMEQLMHCYLIFGQSFTNYTGKLERAHDCFCDILEKEFHGSDEAHKEILTDFKITTTRSYDTCEVEKLKQQQPALQNKGNEKLDNTPCYRGVDNCVKKFNEP